MELSLCAENVNMMCSWVYAGECVVHVNICSMSGLLKTTGLMRRFRILHSLTAVWL